MFKKFFALFTVMISGLMIISACQPATVPVTEEAAPAEEVVKVSGDVVIDGSSTVYPITVAVAEDFAKDFSDVRISVGLSGTGGGFKKFCIGETDISNASRAIKNEETQVCADNNIEYVGFLVALDGLTVLVNPENDWVQSLTVEQLGQIMGVNSTIVKWSDIDPSFPNETIKFFIPDPDSGTRDYMVEVINKAMGEEDLRQDENTSFNSDDNVLLDGIANDKYAFGFFGYAYYVSNSDKVNAVAIVNKDGEAVLPSDETVQNGSYNPLSRPLFIYVNQANLLAKPQLAEFVKFYFGEMGGPAIMSDVGYSMPPAGTYETNLSALAEALGQ